MIKATALESKNLNKYSAIVLTCLTVCGAYIYVWTFYLEQRIEERFIFEAKDTPYVVPGFNSIPIVGVHKFGDFVSQLSYASVSNPYDLSLALPSPYPPLGIALFKFFSPLNPKISILIFVFISIIFLILSLKVTVYRFTKWNFTLVLLCFLVLSKPFLLAIDRGNLQIIVVGLCFIAVYFLSAKNYIVFGLVIAIAASIKAYPVLLLVILIKQRKFKILIISLLSIVALTLFSLFTISNKFDFSFILGMLKGMAVQSGYPTSGISLASWIMRVLEAINLYNPIGGQDSVFRIISLFSAITFGWYVFVRNFMHSKYPKEIEPFILIGSIPLLIPVSWDYNSIAISLCAIRILFLDSEYLGQFSPTRIKLIRKLSLGIIVASIPFPIIWSGEERVNVGVLDIIVPPIFVLLAIILTKTRINE